MDIDIYDIETCDIEYHQKAKISGQIFCIVVSLTTIGSLHRDI